MINTQEGGRCHWRLSGCRVHRAGDCLAPPTTISVHPLLLPLRLHDPNHVASIRSSMYVSLFDIRSGTNNHRLPQGPVYAIDWCKSPAPGQQLRPRSAFRLGIASFTEDFRNRIAVVGLQDDRVLVEDDYGDYPDFVTLVEVTHGYPATALQWQPSTASSFAWSQKAPMTELLATTGDSLRIFEYTSDAPIASSSFVGRQASSGGHRLSLKAALSGVRPSLTYSSRRAPNRPGVTLYSNPRYKARAAARHSPIFRGTRRCRASWSRPRSIRHVQFGIWTRRRR